MKPERIAFWRNNKNWTIQEMVFLLKEQEPVPLEELCEPELTKIERELYNWRLFVADGPEILARDLLPLTTRCNSTVLLDWVATLEGIEIPEIWTPLLSEPNCNERVEGSSSITVEVKTNDERPLKTKERKTLLLIIAALSKEAGIDLLSPYAAESNGVICAHLADFGVEISENTIANKLKEAKEIMQNF